MLVRKTLSTRGLPFRPWRTARYSSRRKGPGQSHRVPRNLPFTTVDGDGRLHTTHISRALTKRPVVGTGPEGPEPIMGSNLYVYSKPLAFDWFTNPNPGLEIAALQTWERAAGPRLPRKSDQSIFLSSLSRPRLFAVSPRVPNLSEDPFGRRLLG